MILIDGVYDMPYKDIERQRLSANNSRNKLHDEAIFYYSKGTMKCGCHGCDVSERQFLTIDHINGDGEKHRREIGVKSGSAFYRWLKRSNFPDGFQVLCFNCNCARANNSGKCPGHMYGVENGIVKTNLWGGLTLLIPYLYRDSRGYFCESYSNKLMPDFKVAQENHVMSSYGVIRGLHFSINPGQAKLIRVIKGKILDIAVDINPKSPTFKKHTSIELSEINRKQLFIPAGFAHGYSVLSENAEVVYKCDNNYVADHEKGIIWNDNSLGIDWQIKNPILSERDSKNPTLEEYSTMFKSDQCAIPI